MTIKSSLCIINWIKNTNSPFLYQAKLTIKHKNDYSFLSYTWRIELKFFDFFQNKYNPTFHISDKSAVINMYRDWY